MLRSADCRPNSVFETIGKNAMMTATMMRGVSAKPKKKLSIGVSARIGTVCSTTAHGYRAFSTHLAWLISSAAPTPSTIEIASPMNVTCAVQRRAVIIAVKLDQVRKPTSSTRCGGGSMNRWYWLSASSETRYQRPMITPATPAGRPNRLTSPPERRAARDSCARAGAVATSRSVPALVSVLSALVPVSVSAVLITRALRWLETSPHRLANSGV